MSLDKQATLENALQAISKTSYALHSRTHPLRSFCAPGIECFVKRDDELGFGISGSKMRKYASLIPSLLSKEIKEVVVIGSAYSNHVLGIAQLLLENALVPTLFIRGDPKRQLKGNAFLNTLFVPSSSLHWFSKEAWSTVQQQARLYAAQRPHATFILPEGACLVEALPGALSLPLDILHNEKELGKSFNHLFIDSGTGLTAIALILGYCWLEKQTQIHVLLMADTQADFLKKLAYFHAHFSRLLQIESMPFPANFHLYHPQSASRFGRINSGIFKDILSLARTEGFLTDPIYTAKLFKEAKSLLTTLSLQGSVLIHHAGGALTLMGFEEQLRAALTAFD